METSKQKTKILYIITKSVWAGAGVYVHDLATNLPDNPSKHSPRKYSGQAGQGFEVFVAAGGNNELAQKIKETPIKYFQIKNFRRDVNIIKDMLAIHEIFKLLFEIRPDIVHVNSSKAGGIVGVSLAIYKLLSREKPYSVFTAHGWAFSENRSFVQIKLIKLFSKLTCLFYNKIICVSECDKNNAIKNKIAPVKKLVTIHNGIKAENYNFFPKLESREKLIKHTGLENTTYEKEIWIGTIGEFTKNKGHVYLIETAKKLVQTNNKNIKFFIIGFGGEKKRLEKEIKKNNLQNNVFLIENLFPAHPYLKAFDIFVFPSLKEGLPYVILEAGLARLPVIASDTGGIPEIIRNPSTGSGQATGILVEPANADKLKKAIENIAHDNETKSALAFSLWEKINRDFTLDKMISSTLTTYNKNSES